MAGPTGEGKPCLAQRAEYPEVLRYFRNRQPRYLRTAGNMSVEIKSLEHSATVAEMPRTVAAVGLYVGREIRQRYKFNKRTPYDFYSNAGNQQSTEFGVGI